MKVLTAVALAASFADRFPNAQPGVLKSLDASAESGTVDSIQAAAVKGFASVSGKLVWVKATEHFYQSGELIQAGDFVQVEDNDARRLINVGRAEYASDEQVAAAQSAPKGKN